MIPLPTVFLDRPIAHRALHDISQGRPENSRAAISAAIAAGYGIEIDVQLSSDNAAMVFHDDNLDRLTAKSGPVRNQDRASLRSILLKGGHDGIPDLSEILDLVSGQVPLLIEIKDQDGAMGPKVGPLEQAVATALSQYIGPVAVMSFNPNAVAYFRDVAPKTPRGLVTSAYTPEDWALPKEVCDHLRRIPDYEALGASFISHEAGDLERPRVSELKQAGARILCWTVRSAEEDAKARKIAENVTFEGYRP